MLVTLYVFVAALLHCSLAIKVWQCRGEPWNKTMLVDSVLVKTASGQKLDCGEVEE